MKTIRQSKVIRTCKGACRVGDIVIFDVLGAAPRGSGATEAAARDAVRRLAEILKIPFDDFNGEAFQSCRADARPGQVRPLLTWRITTLRSGDSSAVNAASNDFGL
jgi:hypothetical protein